MQISFTYNFYYNGKPSWIGTLDASVVTLRWNISGYWEILGWPPAYGIDPRNYVDTLIPNEINWLLYSSPGLVFTTFNLDLGSCPIIPIVYDCTLAGNIILTACVLEGTSIIIEITTTTTSTTTSTTTTSSTTTTTTTILLNCTLEGTAETI